ncbi:AAA family ATPase [Schleiferiaceae bacterium]|nr:AAA family ATPase [Schleiferiaceae bacterium]
MKTTRIVLTGAPATGKTTVSQLLEGLGHTVFHEQAREIISNSLENGTDILPWKDLMAFTQVVWDLRNEQYDSALLETKNFYDRTILDSYAYLIKGNVEPTESWTRDMKNRRFDKVFLLPVWPEIHALDSERMETLEDCVEVEKFIIEAYEEMDYELIIVPKIPVKDRVAFILERL